MAKKLEGKAEVEQKFALFPEADDYGRARYFTTRDEAVEAAQKATFKNGDEVLVYQAVEKAVPNTREVKLEKLT